MLDPRFNNNFQNVIPNQDTTVNSPYQVQYSAPSHQTPYAQWAGGYQAPGSNIQNDYYPQPSYTVPEPGQSIGYAEGGEVKKPTKKEKYNPYPELAQMIQKQGKGEDMILAHINPLEAMILKGIGGSGTINPKTGLLQFGLFSNPGKWFKSVIGPAAGTVIGNMILPGLGGVIGGALGGAAGSAARGRKDYGQSALRGAAIGGITPSFASLLGSGSNAIGASGTGSFLSNYGTQNAVLPSLGKLIGMSSSLSGTGSTDSSSASSSPLTLNLFSTTDNSSPSQSYTSSVSSSVPDNRSFFDKLIGKSSDFLSDPMNLLTTAVVGSSLLNRPKKETPESKASDKKRYDRALRLSPQELAELEAYELSQEQARRRVARNKFLPEERFNIEPLYRKSHTPKEYKDTGRWLSYYNNPQFMGNPIPYKEGGSVGIRPEIVSKMLAEAMEIIEDNKRQHNGLLNEPSLIKALSQQMIFYKKNYGLTEAEDNEVSRQGEEILKRENYDNEEFVPTKRQRERADKFFNELVNGSPVIERKEGGAVYPKISYQIEEIRHPFGMGMFLQGIGRGQDDDVRMDIPEGYDRALRLSPLELAELEAYELSQEQARRRVARNKFLPEERFNIARNKFLPEERFNVEPTL